MRVITVLMVVVSSLAVGNCAGESRKIDEVPYKNHRTSSNRNETLLKTYPVYPAQVYANLSNVRDFHPSKTTEMPADEVRMFFTASTVVGKRRSPQDATASTTSIPSAGSVFRTVSPPSTYIVTARNVIGSSTDDKDSNKSPIYSIPNRSWTEVKDAAQDFRGTPTVDESKSKTKFNGTKIRRVLKAQNQVAKPTQLQSPLHATNVNAVQVPPPSFAGNQWNSTSFVINSKANATGLASSSKPFATVMVPKHVLDGGVVQHQQKQQVQHQQKQQVQQQQQLVQRDDSFHPIVAPMFTPYKSSNGVAIDTNSIDTNRRVSSSDAKTLQSPTHRAAAATTSPKVTKYGFTKPLTYKVEEYVPGDRHPSVNHGNDDEQDRSDRVSVFNTKREAERLQNYASAPRNDGTAAKRVGEPFTYGFTDQAQPAVKEPFNNDGGPLQFREFYQATEWPAVVKHENYHPRTSQSEFAAPSKEYVNGPVTRTRYPVPESDGPEYTMGDHNPKEVLKYLIRDMLKSKQPSEVKTRAPETAADDLVDSYFTSNRQNVESTLKDIYDIESDMNCNLRSSKYITDGHCMSTKPVVEVVCADRCLVAANSLSHRHRSSSLDNQQVEALHCVDGDVKMVRVQLKCRDGNMFHNVIKVVTNCRCKLHPVQPQMRSNTPRSRTRETINPEIMAIAAGTF